MSTKTAPPSQHEAEHLPGFDPYEIDDFDFDDEPLSNDYEPLRAPEAGLRQMGRVGIKEYRDLPQPLIEIEVQGVEPAHYAPAGARPYEGPAERGLDIDEVDGEKVAREYLSSLFPHSEFSFLGAGRNGVVLADQTGKAYKLYRSAFSYSRAEKEAGALKLLSDAGLAPKLHLFVDAGEQYRLDEQPHKYRGFGFEGVPIPRQNSGRELPVMVMDSIDAVPVEDAAPEKLIDGFCRVADVFIKENIHAWDTEVMLNRATGEVIILDVGELTQGPLEQLDPEARRENEMDILKELCRDFGFDIFGIQNAYKQGGLGEVRNYLTQSIH